MGIRVKHGVATTVSIPIVIGRDEATGEYATQEKLFLPGALLPSNTHPSIRERLSSGDEHLNSLLADDGDDGVELSASPFNIVDKDLSANPFAQADTGSGEQSNTGDEADPAATEPPAPAVDYDDLRREELDAELAKRMEAGRDIDVVGTGANGNIVAKDIAAALKADDEAQAA